MTAAGKITAKEIGSRPLGSVRVLLTDDRLGGPATPGHSGPWLPAKLKRDTVAATVTNVEYVSGSRRHKVYLTTDRGSVCGVLPNQTFWLAPADTPPAPRREGQPVLRNPAFLLTDSDYTARGAVVVVDGRFVGHDTSGRTLFDRKDMTGAEKAAKDRGFLFVTTTWYGVRNATNDVSAPDVVRAEDALCPADQPATVAPAPAPVELHTTPKLLQDTRGVRILITERYEDGAGGGAGQWCAAKKIPPRHGALSVPGEPPHVHAVTVIEVRPSATPRRFDVVTDLGTVEGVTAGQRFRLAPASMRSTVDIRAAIREDQERTEARKELNRTHPRDVDGNRVAPGELVELLSVNDAEPGGAGNPYRVTRAIRAYGVVGGVLVARPYERAYGDNPAGTGLALTFRRLADQADGPTAVRSCGCPAPVRDAIVPPPADGGTDAWGYALAETDRENVEDRTHRTGCRWFVELEPARPYVPAPKVVPAVLDTDAVRIERHSGSVTQREVSVFYRGELLGRFGDDVELCKSGSNGYDPHTHDDGAVCYGGYAGHGDQRWHDVAAYEVGKRTPVSAAKPAPFVSRWSTIVTK